ncbi:MAG: hypothetical protein HUU16_20215 [Candidatus Omnitrophica bacterium]|nr:hypothetical protein [Candidatus Omnitrophota bacterium]
MTLAELMERFPQSMPALYKHFGASCFECPGVADETVELGARVHRVEEEFWRDLLDAVSSGEVSEVSLDSLPGET